MHTLSAQRSFLMVRGIVILRSYWWQFLQEADPRCTVDCLEPRFFALEFTSLRS